MMLRQVRTSILLLQKLKLPDEKPACPRAYLPMNEPNDTVHTVLPSR